MEQFLIDLTYILTYYNKPILNPKVTDTTIAVPEKNSIGYINMFSPSNWKYSLDYSNLLGQLQFYLQYYA